MKKVFLVLCLVMLVTAPVYAQTAASIVSWSTQENIFPTEPVDYALEMAGGIAMGEYLYACGGYLPNASGSPASDSDLVWRWHLDDELGTLEEVVWETKLPDPDNYAYIFEMVTGYNNAIYIAGGGYNFSANGGTNPDFVTWNHINSDGSLDDDPWLQSTVFPTANDKDGPGTGPYAPEMGGSVICENGFLYVFGGDQENTDSVLSLDCFYAEIQSDGSLGAWQTGTQLPDYFWFGGSCSIGNYIIACPGIKGSRSRPDCSDLVYVCKVNADGSMGAWVEQTEKLPVIIYNQSFDAAGTTIFCAGGRDNSDGTAEDYVWRSEFNTTTGTTGAWEQTDAQLPAPAYYHQLSYSDYTKRLYVYSIRRSVAPAYPNEVMYSNRLFDLPTPTPPPPTATPSSGLNTWDVYK